MHPYTINTAANMNAALAAGVDGMFTNFSDVLIGILGPRKATGLQGALDAKNSHDACLARNPEGRRRRRRAGDALADARRAGLVRRLHPGRGEGLHGLDDRQRHLERAATRRSRRAIPAT